MLKNTLGLNRYIDAGLKSPHWPEVEGADLAVAGLVAIGKVLVPGQGEVELTGGPVTVRHDPSNRTFCQIELVEFVF